MLDGLRYETFNEVCGWFSELPDVGWALCIVLPRTDSRLSAIRKRAGTDSYLGTSEHRTEEADLGPEVSFRVPPRLALHHYLAPGVPEQSPFRRKVLHLDHTRGHR
jgi:hypothetical protein